MDQQQMPQETQTNLTSQGLQHIVNQIVASNLTGAMLARMETSIAKEPHKDYSLDENYSPLVARVTSEVLLMYTSLWEALENIAHNAEGIGEDTQTDPSVTG
jgi:hypothetical protein